MSTLDLLYAILGMLATTSTGAFASWKVAQRKAAAKQLEEDEQREREIAQLRAMRDEIVRLKATSIPPPSREREDRRAAARAAGFRPGDTASYERTNSLGDMRCNAHEGMVAMVNDLRTAIAAAASAASVASAAAMRVEEVVRSQAEHSDEALEKQADRMTTALEKLNERLDQLGRWQGAVDARLTSVERELGRLQNGPVRGGAAAER